MHRSLYQLRLTLTMAIAGGVLLLAGCGSGSTNKPAVAPAAPSQAPATLVAARAATATPAGSFRPPTPASSPAQRVNGTVQTVSGNTVTLTDSNSLTLSPQTAVTVRRSGTASDLKSGSTVAITAKPQADSTLLASIIVVFPATTNIGLGQRPLDAGNLMTNATVDKVQGTSFTATFPGGSANVSLAPDVQISLLGPGTTADVKPGAMITASVLNGVAQTVSLQ